MRALMNSVEELARAKGVVGFRVGYKKNVRGEHVIALIVPEQPP
jgi:hypothetical protein